MGVLIVQNNFTHGEFDPKLVARTDLQFYMQGGQQLRDVVVIPQGGAKRRFGLQFLDTITATSGEYMLAPFQTSDTNLFLLVFTNLLCTPFQNDVELVGKSFVTPFTGAQLASGAVKFAQNNDTLILVHPDLAPRQIIFDGVNFILSTITFKNLPSFDFAQNYDAITFTLSATTVGTRTITASAPLFDADYVGGTFLGVGSDITQNIGFARLTVFTTNVLMTLEIQAEFGSGTIVGDQAFLGVPAWGGSITDRGWPKTVTFYESRLFFGGSKSLVQTLWGSVVNSIFDFNESIGRDDDGLNFDMANENYSEINNMVSGRSLQIFTSSAEFAIPQLDETPITPTNISIRKQTSDGSENIRPIIIDNVVFFVASGGKRILSFDYAESVGSYQTQYVSILSPHLIRSPIALSFLRGSTTDDANYLFCVNGEDGTMAVYQSIKEQDISAWTLATIAGTDGEIKAITALGQSVYFIVERTINSVTVQYLEKLNFDRFTDSAKNQIFVVPTTVIPGLTHLEGEVVTTRARKNGETNFFSGAPKTVVAGSITMDEAIIEVEVGLGFTSTIQPMPVTIQSDNFGNAMYVPKRLTRIFVDYFLSVAITIDGDLIPYIETGPAIVEAPVPRTAVFEKVNYTDGWNRRQAPVIEQKNPMPMTIMGIGYQVDI